jgi:hypothetical protein
MLTNLTVATELFHAPDETAFADIIIEGHRETWPIRSSRFRLWPVFYSWLVQVFEMTRY